MLLPPKPSQLVLSSRQDEPGVTNVRNDPYLLAGWCFIGIACAVFLIGLLSSI
jgi:hypothetical protein